MKKISKDDLKGLKKEGLTVRRKMGAQPSMPESPTEELPEKEVTPPTPEVERPHASMAASMAASAAESEALRVLVAKNAEVMEGFREDLQKIARPASEYTFDILRDEDKLLKRIHARPGIIED